MRLGFMYEKLSLSCENVNNAAMGRSAWENDEKLLGRKARKVEQEPQEKRNHNIQGSGFDFTF